MRAPKLISILAFTLFCSPSWAIFLEDARWSEQRTTAETLCTHVEEEFREKTLRRDFEHILYPRQARFVTSNRAENEIVVSP